MEQNAIYSRNSPSSVMKTNEKRAGTNLVLFFLTPHIYDFNLSYQKNRYAHVHVSFRGMDMRFRLGRKNPSGRLQRRPINRPVKTLDPKKRKCALTYSS